MLIELQSYREFDALISDIQACRICPEMEGCTRVLSWANGAVTAKIMFVGEAPGRLGADRTNVPFHGDKAGDNFEHLIELAGLTRSQIFVTNAVLCNPRDSHGNNAPPSKTAVRNCAANLQRQIDIMQPVLVVTLGAVALEAARQIEPHELSLARDVRTAATWNGRLLIPLYHPGARAMVHRNFAAQTADYYFVGETFCRLSRPKRAPRSMAKPQSMGWNLVRFMVSEFGRCSVFRLHKTMYLVELRTIERMGSRATDFVYLRQKDGPYCVELGSRWYRRFEDELSFQRSGDQTIVEWRSQGLFNTDKPSLPDEMVEIVADVVKEVSALSDASLKTKSYLTRPMKDRLRAERRGQAQLNRPLL
jgi:uracil-DNA glycosylase family 4